MSGLAPTVQLTAVDRCGCMQKKHRTGTKGNYGEEIARGGKHVENTNSRSKPLLILNLGIR